MKKIVLWICLGISSLDGFAQQAVGAATSFSLKQAIDYAFQNQVNVKNAVLDEAIAKQKVKEVTGMGLPQIGSSFDVKDFLEIPTSLVPAEFFGGAPGTFAPVQFGTQYQATAGLDASQLLFSSDFFLALKANKVFLELSERATERTKIETAVAVSKAYYTVLVNDERLKLMQANVARLKKTMEDTKALNENGFVEKIDYDRLSVIYNNLLVEQEKVQRLLGLGTYLLKYQMGMDVNATILLTDKLDDVKLDIASNLSAEKFDYTKRVEYNLFQTQYNLSKLELKRNKLSYLPNAFAYGVMSANAQRNQFDIFDTDKGWYPTAIVGATIKMPIFTSGQRHFKIQQAKLSLQKAQNNIDFIKQSIDLELASSITMLQNASSSLSIQKKNIELAEEVFRVSKIKYDQGVGSNLEMITAETSLKEAQTNYYNALFDALVAKIDFDKANGTLIK
jgi:outer membrane protein TolC